MGGGKGQYKMGGNEGLLAGYEATKIAKDLYESTSPIRQGFYNEWGDLNEGKMPFSFQTMYAPAKQAIEDQYGIARENVLANTPMGGGLFDQLTNVETARAGQLSQTVAQAVQDMVSKAYGAAFQSPQTSVQALGIPAQIGQAAWGAAEQGAQARSNFCCFIFCATDPKDMLLEYVRQYKDSHYDIDSNVAQGYKRLALWLVPSMRRHQAVKKLIKFVMVHPMELYAQAHYEDKVWKKILLSPISKFWTLTYALIGNYYGLRGWMQYWRLIDRW